MSKTRAEWSCCNPVALVFGTRPEAVKLAPVARALDERGIPFKIMVTGQHRELLDQMLSLFKLKVSVDLNLMKTNQSLTDFGGRALQSLGKLFREERPSIVVVQGDTSTVLFSALAAFYEKIPVAHVEAGLRSFNMEHPFPEEANRSLTGRITRFHFAPTSQARTNLLNEGIEDRNIFVTGNTVIDSLQYVSGTITPDSMSPSIKSILEEAGDKKIILLTAHRRENFGEPMRNIFSAVKDICRKRKDIVVVYPVHPNPNVRNQAYSLLDNVDNVHLVEPLSYIDFVGVMKAASLCLTDSGGVQEEAPGLRVPVLVLRETTERPEGVEAGCATLVGSNRELICSKALELLDKGLLASGINPYGNGQAGQKIAAVLRDHLLKKMKA
jgi:UDP-N-acetylglucosamine 2-epimerase (non-hydrolysing)